MALAGRLERNLARTMPLFPWARVTFPQITRVLLGFPPGVTVLLQFSAGQCAPAGFGGHVCSQQRWPCTRASRSWCPPEALVPAGPYHHRHEPIWRQRESSCAAFWDVGWEGPSSGCCEHCLRGRNTGDPRGKNTETKEMEKLTHLEALLFTAVLETCVDQLSILGYIMPVSYEGQPDLSHSGIQEMKEIVGALKEPDSNYQESAKQGSRETVTSTSLKSIKHKQQLRKTEELKSTRHLSHRTVKKSALSIENLKKIQADRQYASDVITATMKRIQESGTFNSLIEANEREEAKKSKFHDILIREQEGKKQIKSLEKQLQDVKKQTETELKSRDAMILNLEDELQEIKAKLSMESFYAKKSTDLQVHETQKRCNNAENILDKEIQKLKSKLDEEGRVHMAIEDFLRQNHQKVEEKLEFWVDKYENDTDAKDKELDALKALRANNLEILQRLAKECQIFEKAIITDRAEKDAKRKQIERDALELKCALKLQSWWRGTMVRKNLGPYQGLKKKLEKKKSDHKEKGEKKNAREKKQK